MVNIYFYKPLLFIIIFSLVWISGIMAQLPQIPYEPLKFNDLKYEWYVTSKDHNRLPPVSDGYNCFKPTFTTGPSPIVHQGFIYTTSYRSNQDIIYDGAYIEKRDIKNGQLIWQRYFGINGNNTRVEYPRLMYINDDNQLELISQQNPLPKDSIEFNLYFDNLFLTKRVYDLSTGDLISNIQPDPNVDDYIKSDIFITRETTKLYREKNGTRIFFKSQIKNLEYWAFNYITTVVNPLDHQAVYDTLRSEYSDTDFPYFKMKEDLFLIVESIDSTNQYVFKYVDGKMKVLREVKSTSLDWSWLSGLEILEYDDVSKTFIARLHNVDLETGKISSALVIFDTDANFIKNVKIPDGYEELSRVLSWKNEKLKILGYKCFDGCGIDFLEKVDGVFSVVSSSLILNEFKAVALSKIVETDDLFILPLWEQSFYYNTMLSRFVSDQFGDAVSLMAIPKGIFGVSSTNVLLSSNYTLNPNPSNTHFNIGFDKAFNGQIIIRNVNGYLIDKIDVKEISNYLIDCSNWQAGIYFVTLNDNKGYINTSKVIKF